MDKTRELIYIFFVARTPQDPAQSSPRSQQKSFSRYLPVNSEALRWEIHCNDAGFSRVPAGSSYPLVPEDHPRSHAATVVTGRVLEEFQVVYITAGRGVFECENQGEVHVSAGDAFILFPGVRHRYQPLREIGWHEYWVGFSGEHPHRLWRNGVFSPRQSLYSIGFQQEVLADFEQIIQLCRRQTPGFQVRMGALVLQLLAHIHAIETTSRTSAGDSSRIHEARQIMLDHLDTGMSVEDIAVRAGVGYNDLLSLFRQYTGLTPYQYFLQMRIHRAKELLKNRNISVKEVAAIMNFENQYYFSRIFHRKTGMSPTEWRQGLGSMHNPVYEDGPPGQ